MSVVDNDRCSDLHFPIEMLNTTFCTGDVVNGGVGPCVGDDGGPLVLPGTNTLVGIASWRRGCADKDFPSVNTKVADYVDWIMTNAGLSV